MRAMDGSTIQPRELDGAQFEPGQVFSTGVEGYLVFSTENSVRWRSLSTPSFCGKVRDLSGFQYYLSLTHGGGMDGQLHLPVTPVTPL